MSESLPERALARFVVDLTYEGLPESVADQVGLVTADSVGAVVGGNTLSEVERLAELEAASTPGQASILGTPHAAAAGHAALLNATGGTSLELDEGHKFASGHPAIHVLPAVLAEAELTDGSGRDFATSLVAGYEVGARVARACVPLDDTYHMHGVWGAVGAAAGVAKYRGLSVDETTEAIRMAANHALHTRFETALEGATVRNTYAGMNNLSGIVVANQAEAGFTGLQRGLERHLDRLSAESFSNETATDRLGDHWEITRGYFKRHAACRFTHPTLDALDALLGRADVPLDDVDTVTVETYSIAAKLTPVRPTNPLQAKFSIPFAVATRLVHGHSRKPAFTEAAFTDDVFDLAERVNVVDSAAFTDRVPDERGARVTVTLTDGTELREEVRQAQGGANDPFEEDDLREKFDSLVEPVLGDERADGLWAAARRPTESDPATICRLASRE